MAATTLTRTAAGGAVVDVRQAPEFGERHVDGAMAIEFGALPGLVAEVPDDVAVMCGHGERAMTAASLLERSGREASVFEGSPADWARSSGERLVRIG